jgi:hypothetical protein
VIGVRNPSAFQGTAETFFVVPARAAVSAAGPGGRRDTIEKKTGRRQAFFFGTVVGLQFVRCIWRVISPALEPL